MAGHELYISEMLESFKEDMSKSMEKLSQDISSMSSDMERVAENLKELSEITGYNVSDPMLISADDTDEDAIIFEYEINESLAAYGSKTLKPFNCMAYAHGVVKTYCDISVSRAGNDTARTSKVTYSIVNDEVKTVEVVTKSMNKSGNMSLVGDAEIDVAYGDKLYLSLNISNGADSTSFVVTGTIKLVYKMSNSVEMKGFVSIEE